MQLNLLDAAKACEPSCFGERLTPDELGAPLSPSLPPGPLWIDGLAALRGVRAEGESGPQRPLPDPDAADPPFANAARQNGVKD
jgi:hypothetical protein